MRKISQRKRGLILFRSTTYRFCGCLRAKKCQSPFSRPGNRQLWARLNVFLCFRARFLRRSIPIIAACVATLLCSSCGPRMNIQRSIHPYQQQMPAKPVGTTPTTGRLATLTAQQAKLANNPLPVNGANLANGKIYYGYYCLMCHGDNGDGNGPVGQGYVPKPTDLSTLTGLTDGQIYTRMLTGKGHDPVMSQTVQPERRWPLVMYVRGFGRK
jgi:mono/diheme cytochrome c family protein